MRMTAGSELATGDEGELTVMRRELYGWVGLGSAELTQEAADSASRMLAMQGMNVPPSVAGERERRVVTGQARAI